MNSAVLAFHHFRIMTLDHLRHPAYMVPTVVFPSLFFAIFGVPEATEDYIANILVGSFSAFAVFGVVFMQFGVGIANERSHPWSLYMRTLPLSPSVVMSARIGTAIFFSSLTVVGVIIIGVSQTPVSLTTNHWFHMIAGLTLGSLPFIFMGTSLGYLCPPKSAVPIANLIYLPLSFAGGLWKPPELLPESVQTLSEFLPTRYYGEIVWQAVKGESWTLKPWLYLAGFALFFFLLTLWSYRRDQVQRLK